MVKSIGIARAALARGHQIRRIFFYNDGVNNASKLTEPPHMVPMAMAACAAKMTHTGGARFDALVAVNICFGVMLLLVAIYISTIVDLQPGDVIHLSDVAMPKGVTALGSMMMLAATRAGVAELARAELERSHAALITQFQRAVPDMFDKAYRFDGEMLEIADYVGEDPQARQMYEAISAFYTRIAADHAGPRKETGALAAFLKKKT